MGRLFITLAMVYLAPAIAHSNSVERGLVESAAATNTALLVGVSHGLPGIDIDVKNVETIATDKAYQFQSFQLNEAQGTQLAVAKELEKTAKLAGTDGSYFFYFSGHGSADNIYLQDGLFSVSKMRLAIEAGRKSVGPLARLVLMFDSCYSGSLLGPFNRLLPKLATYDPTTASSVLADRVASEFIGRNRAYWKKLFVFASSRADETSLAGDEGSIFTVALKKAYDETMLTNGTMREWIEKTKTYTEGHHPVERLEPSSLYDEKMDPAQEETAG